MNEPIISPWLIYFIGVSEPISILLKVLGMLTFMSAIVVIVFAFAETKSFKFQVFSLTIPLVAILFFVISTLIPPREYIVAMAVSNEITYERVESASEKMGEGYNIVMNDFRELLDRIEKKKD